MTLPRQKIAVAVIMAVVIAAGFLFFYHRATIYSLESQSLTPTGDKVHTPLTISSSPAPVTETGEQKLLEGMKMTFDDEFNSLSLYRDANGNVTCNDDGSGTWQTVYDFCSRTIFTNDEAEIYIDQNFLDYMNSQVAVPSKTLSPFSINAGVLAITASPSDSIIQKAAGSWAQYTSGMLTTQFSFSQEYGYFEIRAQLPAGKGLWPAFWLLPTDKSWPPEIDVMEAFGATSDDGQGGTTMIHYADHSNDASDSCGNWYDTNINITSGFHTYGVDWEPTGITYYFDGQPYATCPANPDANKPFYMLVNLAVGAQGSWPGTPNDSDVWPAKMLVDYVRAYQKK